MLQYFKYLKALKVSESVGLPVAPNLVISLQALQAGLDLAKNPDEDPVPTTSKAAAATEGLLAKKKKPKILTKKGKGQGKGKSKTLPPTKSPSPVDPKSRSPSPAHSMAGTPSPAHSMAGTPSPAHSHSPIVADTWEMYNLGDVQPDEEQHSDREMSPLVLSDEVFSKMAFLKWLKLTFCIIVYSTYNTGTVS